MVSTCQGLEHDLILNTAGREPSDNLPFGQVCLLDRLLDVYVMTTLTRCNLFIVALLEYF